MYKVKRILNQGGEVQKEFTSSSGKKYKFPDVKRLVKEDIKNHKVTYDILSR
jgi:predicted methyltransferase